MPAMLFAFFPGKDPFDRNSGDSFGGIPPQWFGEVGLFMQKTLSKPNWEGIYLFSERAKGFLEFIKADWQQ